MTLFLQLKSPLWLAHSMAGNLDYRGTSLRGLRSSYIMS